MVLGLSNRFNTRMNIPNFITILRILMVPVTVWLMISEEFGWAFTVFLIAGISDGLDGYLARRLGEQTELGAYLDPIADKLLLVSAYGVLGIIKVLPAWLVVMVISRDVLIIGGVLLARLLERPFAIKPLRISKMNTAAQITFAGVALAVLSSNFNPSLVLQLGGLIVALFTLISGAYYIRDWILHMNKAGDVS